MSESMSHTMKLRVDEFTTITITYSDTELDWVDFMFDAAQLLTEYAYKHDDFLSVTTTVRH